MEGWEDELNEGSEDTSDEVFNKGDDDIVV